jgi:hypothetical protein
MIHLFPTFYNTSRSNLYDLKSFRNKLFLFFLSLMQQMHILHRFNKAKEDQMNKFDKDEEIFSKEEVEKYVLDNHRG